MSSQTITLIKIKKFKINDLIEREIDKIEKNVTYKHHNLHINYDGYRKIINDS